MLYRMADGLAHRIWFIPETVLEIMQHSASDKRSLGRCALVSRGFSKPALEALWKELPGPHPLFALLPSSTAEKEHQILVSSHS